MSDLDKFLKLYKELGIDCNVYNDPVDDDKFIVFRVEPMEDVEESNKSTYSDKFGGHINSYSVISFDKHGKFISQCFWQD
jgi:hypothetical protein